VVLGELNRDNAEIATARTNQSPLDFRPMSGRL